MLQLLVLRGKTPWRRLIHAVGLYVPAVGRYSQGSLRQWFLTLHVTSRHVFVLKVTHSDVGFITANLT